MARPFDSIKILDFTHVLAGPFCAYQFALLGADVIKIESLHEPDCARGRGPDQRLNATLRGLNYQVQGANKRALAVDLKSSAGRDVVFALSETADVLIENYRSGAMSALELGYETISAINPNIIYCSMTGYGAETPKGTQGAYDNTMQAASGIIDQSGGHKPGVSFVDYAAGYNAAFAISSALFRRQREGRGMQISCSMFETALMMMAPEAAAALLPEKVKRDKEAGISCYETKLGMLMLGAFTPKQYRSLGVCLATLGHSIPQLECIWTWDDVWKNASELRQILAAIFLTQSADYWSEHLTTAGIPAEPVRSLEQAVNDPQLLARHFFQQPPVADGEVNPPQLPVAAYTMSDDGPALVTSAPGLGAHTEEILSELGYSAAKISNLRKQGFVK
jgi:crotonobetainyl-CoA:carnitine CoA-transferase CaiB-like acyl-CoA transferase